MTHFATPMKKLEELLLFFVCYRLNIVKFHIKIQKTENKYKCGYSFMYHGEKVILLPVKWCRMTFSLFYAALRHCNVRSYA